MFIIISQKDLDSFYAIFQLKLEMFPRKNLVSICNIIFLFNYDEKNYLEMIE